MLKEDIKKEAKCQSLKSQAYNNRHNLVIMGLKAQDQKSDLNLALELFRTLGAGDVDVAAAYRLGRQREEDRDYIRPLVIKFNNIEHRNMVWKKLLDITSEDGSHKIRIQADLPKPLREGIQVIHRVVKAATKIPEFESAKINNYQLEINDKTYQVSDLENLPKQLRPSTLSTPHSDTAMVFFTKLSFMSNHHLSNFKIDGESFHSVEQYLAVCRAQLAEKPNFIDRARKSRDPIQAKHILHALREDHTAIWDGKVEDVIMKALRAKFSQNRSLKDKLLNTGQLILGEASRNPCWGIGMDLSDSEVLNTEKWLSTGNLLGESLMKVCEELQQERAATGNRPKKESRKNPK